MTDKAISPLRRRLIEDMTIRRLSPKTHYQYIRHHVKKFADFLGRSADKATAEDVRRYQLWLASERRENHHRFDNLALCGDRDIPYLADEVFAGPPCTIFERGTPMMTTGNATTRPAAVTVSISGRGSNSARKGQNMPRTQEPI